MSKVDTKQLIIKTASDLFYQKGYNLIGINEIIEKTGIAKATLYNHFKSKEDLVVAYLDKRDLELLHNLSAFCNTKAKGKGRLIAILEFLVDFFNDKSFNGCWCLRTMAEVPPDNKRLRKKIKENKESLLSFVKKQVKENLQAMSKLKTENLSKTIYLLYEAAVSESHLQQEVWPIQHSINLLKAILKEY